VRAAKPDWGINKRCQTPRQRRMIHMCMREQDGRDGSASDSVLQCHKMAVVIRTRINDHEVIFTNQETVGAGERIGAWIGGSDTRQAGYDFD
jgi:hypothetical protein